MPIFNTLGGAFFLLGALCAAFLAILFLQSSIDKIVNRRGNLEFLRDHFASSPLAGMVGPMFLVLTVLELAAGTFSAAGCALIVFAGRPAIAFYGAIFSALAILALFFGQRLAKDYPGAATLVPYFLVTLAAIYLTAPR